MVSAFLIYDLAFLIVSTLAVTIFLYKRRSNLQRQGLLYLYRTQVGVRFIDKFAKKYAKILNPLQYIVVASGYILMAGMLWLLIRFSWIYLTSPIAAKALKVPVLIPLIPYLPDIFKIDFLPSFNFTYWIIIIALIAVPHEFAHGIFARLHKIKVHATGFGFLGPFLAAFVEPDEKEMEKTKKFPQLAILASGTFANIIFFILFAFIFWLFFLVAFTPAGVNFNVYATSPIQISQINEINSIPIQNTQQISQLLNPEESLIQIKVNNQIYHASPNSLQLAIENNIQQIQAFDDSPAFRTRLEGAITEINGQKITSYNSLANAIKNKNPGDTINIKTSYQESVRNNKIEERSYTLQLAERDGQAFLGIGIAPPQPSGLIGSVYSMITKIKDPLIFYESSLGTFGWFIYYFLWWSVLILISVALVNMLPVGIFDGGRFFYLTVWGLTGSQTIGKKAFAISTWAILLLVLALMIKWALIFI